MKVLIDTADDIQYKSFYVFALMQHFGGENIRFANAPFNDLSETARNTKSMRFIITNAKSERRYVIHCNDTCKVDDELYQWADIYGCVNANIANTPEQYKRKLVTLCPSFAIRYISPVVAITKAITTLPHCHAKPKKYLGQWKRMMQRATYEDYTPTIAEADVIFHCSTLWQSDEWNRNDQTVNLHRANFIRVCRSISGLQFKGGLVSHRQDAESHQFDDCLSRPYSSADYLRFTKQSIFVFNTPAYWGCNGWKLGEYMALGKAVLSTPLNNDLPHPLKHGEHYHLIDKADTESIYKEVSFMLKHSGYCAALGKNLRNYWDSYGSPEGTLKLLGIY